MAVVVGSLALFLEICSGIFPADSGTQRPLEVAPLGASQGSPISYHLWLCGLPNYIERVCSSGLQPWEKFCSVTHLRPAAVCALRHTGMLRGCSPAGFSLHSPGDLTLPGPPLTSTAVEASGKPGHLLFTAASLSFLVSSPSLTTSLMLYPGLRLLHK